MEKYEEIRKRLLTTREELQRRVESIKADIRHSREPLSQDFAEQAVERENEEVLDALGNAARVELNHIRKALDRMDQGDYEFCTRCGEEIPLARLEIVPYTDLCVVCAERKES